jgi:hypothetical protein
MTVVGVLMTFAVFIGLSWMLGTMSKKETLNILKYIGMHGMGQRFNPGLMLKEMSYERRLT